MVGAMTEIERKALVEALNEAYPYEMYGFDEVDADNLREARS